MTVSPGREVGIPDDESARVSPAARRASLAAALRPYQRERLRGCRVKRIAPRVQLVGVVTAEGAGRLTVRGVSTCGSVHSCPMCAARITGQRSHELCSALESANRKNILLVTLTLRHQRDVPLRMLRKLLSYAYGEMKSGAQGRRMKEAIGYVGDVRSAEVTWGAANGWHPHLHALWFLRAAPPEDCRELMYQAWRSRVLRCLERMRRVAHDRSASYATRKQVLGTYYATHLAECRGILDRLTPESVEPSFENGVDVETLDSAVAAGEYLQKMGLEVSGITTKSARRGHYSHWQIARAAASGQLWAIVLFQEHSAAMYGTRQLTWSRDCRWWLGLCPERPDADVADETEPDPGTTEQCLRTFEGREWDGLMRGRYQAALAELYQQYADGTLEVNGVSPEVVLKGKPVDARPMFWECWDRRLVGYQRDWENFFKERIINDQKYRHWAEEKERQEDRGAWGRGPPPRAAPGGIRS